jgi:hypothetical protein
MQQPEENRYSTPACLIRVLPGEPEAIVENGFSSNYQEFSADPQMLRDMAMTFLAASQQLEFNRAALSL